MCPIHYCVVTQTQGNYVPPCATLYTSDPKLRRSTLRIQSTCRGYDKIGQDSTDLNEQPNCWLKHCCPQGHRQLVEFTDTSSSMGPRISTTPQRAHGPRRAQYVSVTIYRFNSPTSSIANNKTMKATLSDYRILRPDEDPTLVPCVPSRVITMVQK